MLRNIRILFLLFTLSLLLCLGAQPASAQTSDPACASDSKDFTPWLDAFDSAQGEATAKVLIDGEPASADGYFALVDNGEVANSDYFLQITFVEDGYEDFIAVLVKDDVAAFYEGGWEVDHRDYAYDAADIEDAYMQLDSFLTAAFQDLRFIDMSQCLGVEALPTGDAFHYKLSIPPLLGRMLFSQLTGESLDDVEFGEFTLDYWLDVEDRFLAQLNAIIEATDTYAEETIRFDLTLTFTSTDNVKLQLPYQVQLMAMEQGIIQPDLVSEIVVVE